MKQHKNNHREAEEDYSSKALFVFFLIGMVTISATSYLIFNI
jgi:hypothetical protein